ncbi:putative alpha-1 3-mannosyltransferase MNN15 [Bienertia sinuspersici]
MSSTATTAAKSWLQSLKHYFQAPWKITGPVASPEYRYAVPKATEYRPFCPATIPEAAIIPSSNPDTVFDIKYFPRDQRRNRPQIRKTVLKKADVQKMMSEKTSFQTSDFPIPYLTRTIEEDMNTHGGGYQK